MAQAVSPSVESLRVTCGLPLCGSVDNKDDSSASQGVQFFSVTYYLSSAVYAASQFTACNDHNNSRGGVGRRGCLPLFSIMSSLWSERAICFGAHALTPTIFHQLRVHRNVEWLSCSVRPSLGPPSQCRLRSLSFRSFSFRPVTAIELIGRPSYMCCVQLT